MPFAAALLIAFVASAPPTVWTDADPKARPLVAVPGVAPLVARAEPAVLVVFAEGVAPGAALPPGHPPLPEGPGNGGGRGQGAGFLISKDGYALTNHHVVEGATRVAVFVGADHTEVEVEVVGSDERADVALLKLRSSRTDWPTVALADSDAVKVGDFVVAIGSPFGLEQSVSLGIVSARGRRDIAPSGRQGLYDFLQTDASINPGNSGGPLLDVYGAVVGINAAVNAAGNGIGFAIPVNMVKRMLPSLVARGRYERSWIGVSIADVSADLAPGLGLRGPQGALVREVVAGGPADQAGLQPGDVITAFGGRPVRDASELPLLASDAGVGATVSLDVVRDRKPGQRRVTLGSHPDNAKATVVAATPAPSAKQPADASLGFSVASLDGADRARLGLPREAAGARVTRVRPGSAAMLAGLDVDDVVVDVNGATIADADGLAAVVRALPTGDLVKVTVLREGNRVFCALKKP
ncbi:MAG: PDZ domain-containing protein [Deltaproteobacteria bacterium]|nr:PDZ domain-containing protein [Deltaproteobacteria bacterium]